MSERERNAEAPKPLVSVSVAAPIKALPGKTAAERLRFLAGQLVLTGFAGRDPTEADVERVARQLREGSVSGVIVRDSNIASFSQLTELLAAINNAGGETQALIAIDQPGGPETVLAEEKGFNYYHSASATGGEDTPQEAQLQYRAMAGELAALGVSLNIGPSEDACREDGVNLSAYCFGTSPSRIAAFARAFNFGHHDRGVLTALRHAPFRAGLRTAWLNESASSALVRLHLKGETSDALVVRVQAMQPPPLNVPFWKAKAAGALRSGFRGALIAELDMGPGGAPLRYSEVIVRAYQAGADMILLRDSAGLPAAISVLNLQAIEAGLKSGRLQMARLEDAYRHVQLLKARLRTLPARTKIARLDR
jgi:beta-N-acetylhexosaminidase